MRIRGVKPGDLIQPLVVHWNGSACSHDTWAGVNCAVFVGETVLVLDTVIFNALRQEDKGLTVLTASGQYVKLPASWNDQPFMFKKLSCEK